MTYYIEDLPGYSEEELLECFITVSGCQRESGEVEKFDGLQIGVKLKLLISMAYWQEDLK